MSTYLCPREGCGFGVAGEPSPDQWDDPDPVIAHEDEHRREDERTGVPSPQRVVDMAGDVTPLETRLIDGALSRLAEVDLSDAGEHPALPPAATERVALSPMRRTLMVADRLVQQAEAAGIAIGHVSLIVRLGVDLYAADRALTPALAVVLGLARTTVMDDAEPGRSLVFYGGARGDIRVGTHHTVPTAVLAAGAVAS